MLTVFRYGTVKILLDYQAADRHAERSTESCILHIHAYRDLGIVIRREAHEHRVVSSVRVLSRSGLTAYLDPGQIGRTACTAQHSHSHSFGHILVIFPLDPGAMTFHAVSGTSPDWLW